MHQHRIAAAGAALLVAVLTAGPAQAARPFERGTYDDTFTFTSGSCGRTSAATIHQWGRYQLRETQPDAPEVLVHDVGEFTDHFVSADGSWWIRGKVNFQVTDVTDLGGGVWRIEQRGTGRTWSMTSESGSTVWTDRGIYYETIVLDTLGDDDPENDEVLSFDVTWKGPHFFSDNQPGSQYCQYVEEALELG
jgi:hypothetical protein